MKQLKNLLKKKTNEENHENKEYLDYVHKTAPRTKELKTLVPAFLVGGAICAVCQIFIDRTKLTPARILTTLVVLGVLLTAVGVYKPFVDWAGAGATVPLLGFGYVLADGVKTAVSESGLLGAFLGGARAAAGGISAAVFFGLLTALIFRPKDRS